MVHSLEHIRIMLALVLVALVCATGPVAGAPVESVVTDSFFDGIKSQSSSSGCDGTGFYTREAFLNAVQMYDPGFAQGGSEDDGKREIAAFFAHVTHETGSMCHINENDGPSKNYCDPTKTQWPCQQGKGYYGRGPLQLSWNYNYGPAGNDLGFDGLGSPDTLAQDPVMSFKAALWFWKNNMLPNKFMSQGFGATIRAINSNECSGGPDADKMEDRVRLYKQYCQQFGVHPGMSLTC